MINEEKLPADTETIFLKTFLKFLVVFGVIFCSTVLVNIIIGGTWLYFNLEKSITKIAIATTITGLAPIISYFYLSFLYEIRSSTHYLYEHLLRQNITLPISIQVTEEVWKKKQRNEHLATNKTEVDALKDKVIYWIKQKIRRYPNIFRRVLEMVIKYIPITSLVVSIASTLRLSTDTKASLQEFVFEQLDILFKEACNSVVPSWLKLIIPINILLLLVLLFM